LAPRLAAVRDALLAPATTEPAPGSWRARGLVGKAALLAGTGFVGLVVLATAWRLVAVLGNPLG
ncbi:MAG: hypothetical protein ACOZNI_01270, partial [Myxococcota bacterium]